MKLSDGVEWGVHTCVLLAMLPPEQALPAAKIAEFHSVPPSYLAKHLQALAGAGVLQTEKGPRGGYRLARLPSEISVLEIVEAIDGEEPAFRCTEIRRRGPLAMPAREYTNICGIHAAFDRADEAWRAELRSTTIADMVLGVLRDVPAPTIEKGTRWLEHASR